MNSPDNQDGSSVQFNSNVFREQNQYLEQEVQELESLLQLVRYERAQQHKPDGCDRYWKNSVADSSQTSVIDGQFVDIAEVGSSAYGSGPSQCDVALGMAALSNIDNSVQQSQTERNTTSRSGRGRETPQTPKRPRLAVLPQPRSQAPAKAVQGGEISDLSGCITIN